MSYCALTVHWIHLANVEFVTNVGSEVQEVGTVCWFNRVSLCQTLCYQETGIAPGPSGSWSRVTQHLWGDRRCCWGVPRLRSSYSESTSPGRPRSHTMAWQRTVTWFSAFYLLSYFFLLHLYFSELLFWFETGEAHGPPTPVTAHTTPTPGYIPSPANTHADLFFRISWTRQHTHRHTAYRSMNVYLNTLCLLTG